MGEDALDIEESLAASLATLGYSSAWIEWGFLSADLLAEQIAKYHTGQDPNTEHYRYGAFRQILSSRSALTEEEIERYLALVRIDADLIVARAALADLLMWHRLTTQQFHRLSHHPDLADPLFEKLIRRRSLLTELASAPVISTTTFAGCLASRDAVVQRKLIADCRLTHEQWQTLADQGANRAIRNIAHQRGRGQ
jgi:hypothetical protein